MSKPCPIFGRAIYADCLDCDDKYCRSINHNIKLHKGDIVKVGKNQYILYKPLGIIQTRQIPKRFYIFLYRYIGSIWLYCCPTVQAL